ncbi:MAG TPA: SDR family NAD(P)-dependent oxidoreductase [Gaiellaceae bacterium]|jgi:dihydroanticapsin dehydrogenase|nr:SDR family NAD(P)-dependent oxidoreductase [Gaiellaceae bacterium]HVV56870.1 SDR family NAD(P)-dependent oxidoreductase [Gaiellaceae bacterium]
MSGALDSRRVVITGATANIGGATARLFAREGARLVLVDRDPAVEETVASIAAAGGEATAVVADISSPPDVERVAGVATGRLGGVDVLVNNAAVHLVGAVDGFSVEDWDETFAVNVRGSFLMVRALVPALRASTAGAIVNTSSQVGLHGAPGATAYSASKGALIAFTKALALELAGDGIRVNAICPGWVESPFNAPAIAMLGGDARHAEIVRSSVPLGRQGRPEEIAAGTLFLASDASSYMTGQVLAIDGGVT